MVKWIGIAFVAIIAIMIATGNMGGSRDATNNYGKVMRGGWEFILLWFHPFFISNISFKDISITRNL